jgi:hypothetical protein
MLSNRRQLSADGRDVPGLDERRRTQIDVAHVPEYTNDRDQGGAHKTNDHNLEMRPGVRAVKWMVHDNLLLGTGRKRQWRTADFAVDAIFGLNCVNAMRHAGEIWLRLEIKQLATRSRSGTNCEQTVKASFMQACWSSCAPALAGADVYAAQHAAIANAMPTLLACVIEFFIWRSPAVRELHDRGTLGRSNSSLHCAKVWLSKGGGLLASYEGLEGFARERPQAQKAYTNG